MRQPWPSSTAVGQEATEFRGTPKPFTTPHHRAGLFRWTGCSGNPNQAILLCQIFALHKKARYMSSLLGDEKPQNSWEDSFKAFLNPRVIAMLFLGFSAGLPLYLVFSTLSVWLAEAGTPRSEVTFFSWAALGYGFKYVWAPIIDKMPLPIVTALMGQRRAWLLVSQIAVMAALCFMATTDPAQNLVMMAVGSVVLGFSSATQDIVIDAYRIEAARPEIQGIMSSSYIAGYRIGMMVAGAGALELAGWIDVIDGYDYQAWKITYFAMAATMIIGVATTFIISEPSRPGATSLSLRSRRDYLQFLGMFVIAASVFAFIIFAGGPIVAELKKYIVAIGINELLAGFLSTSFQFVIAIASAILSARLLVKFQFVPHAMLQETYISPVTEFFARYGKLAIYMMILISTYRIADIVMGVIANFFYTQIGYEKQEIGRIAKLFGIWMTIFGSFAGGLFCMRWGIIKVLFLGGLLAAASNLLFAVLALADHNLWFLAAVISADNLAGGIATAAFVAYLSSLVNQSFTATQYALFSSIMLLVPKLIAGYSGSMVDNVGYPIFFIGTAVIGIIPLILILYIARQNMLMAKAQPQG